MPSRRYTNLITSGQLSDHLDDKGWRVVDCRFDLGAPDRCERAFSGSHIPGAVYAHLDRDLSGPVTPRTGRHPLPDADRLREWLGSQGISRESQVVVYDDTGGSMAVRLWWLLRWLGHQDVAVLDGGWPTWVGAGLPVTGEVHRPRSARFTGDPDMSTVVSTRALLLPEQARQVVDVRTAERFRGEQEPIDPVAGHIPGAVNLPLQRNLGPDGCFLSPDGLRDLYAPLIQDRRPVDLVFMCGSGVTACHGILAMDVAGLGGARL